MKISYYITIFLLTITAISKAQIKDHSLEIGLYRLSGQRSEYGSLPMGKPALNINYAQKLQSKFYMIGAIGYENQFLHGDQCPGSFCYDFSWENYYAFAGLRYYLSKPSKKYQFFAETGLQAGKYFHYESFSGGFFGDYYQSYQSGLQLVGIGRLGAERTIVDNFFVGANAHIEIGTLYATSSSGYSSGQEALPQLGGSSYGNITFFELRLGYRF